MPPGNLEKMTVVGTDVLRTDGRDKVTGRARYLDDLHAPDAWIGHVLRSPVSHGRLKGLHLDPDFDWSGVVVVTPEDIPGPNRFDMHDKVMPLLATDEILYKGEPLALVAAPTKEAALDAAAHVRFDIDELPAVTTLEEVVAQWKDPEGAPFVLCEQTIEKGDVEAGFAEADEILETEYWAGHQEQMYIEPQALMAEPWDGDGVLVQGSMQCPYYVVNEAHEALGLPPEKVRVRQTSVGGAFGGKEEFPSTLGAYVALLAMKGQRRVKIVYDREEDVRYTTKRHPSWVRHRTGFKKDGTLTAMSVDYLLDGGAYMTISDVVMYRGILHVALAYRCPNVFVNGQTLRTNMYPPGAFRGFGAPQAVWALESHVDEIAARCGMAPHEYRLKHGVVMGDETPTGQILRESVGSPAVMEDALARSGFAEKLARCSHGKAGEERWIGIGMSFFGHGSAFTGDGEAKIGARVAVDLARDVDGTPRVFARVSSTEMGQGAHTVLAQMTAEGARLPFPCVRCPFPDTAIVPDSGPTVASRTTMVVGSALFSAGAKLREELVAWASKKLFGGGPTSLEDGRFRCGDEERSWEEVAGAYLDAEGPLRLYDKFKLPTSVAWDQKRFKGDAYPGYSWGCNVVEVEVDPRTLEIHVPRITASFDIGRVINPLMAKGQVEGGLTQALGYAMMENMPVRDGLFGADKMQTYAIPTMKDIPEYDLGFVECPYPHAAPGAKGVGEVPMNGIAPALGNAVFQATGIRLDRIPITPESLYEALHGKEGESE